MKISKLNLKIQKNNYFSITILSLVLVFVWYINFTFWQSFILNIIFLLIYGYILSIWLGRILQDFGIKKYNFIFGIFSLIFLIGFGMALPIVFYKILPWYLFFLLFIFAIIFSLLQKNKPILKNNKNTFLIINKKLFWFCLILIVLGFLILIQARTGDYVRSPWKIISNVYIYVWLAIVMILGFLIFKGIKIKNFILIFILASLLLHCFVIIPYKVGFGGDKWRHIGAERSLAKGEVYQPTFFGEDATYTKIGPLKIPEVLIVGNKTSYSNMWGVTIALSWLTGFDVFWIDLVLGMLLFSLFLPFLLLNIARFFSNKKKFILIFLLSSFCFYPLILYGSITMPLSFGFLLFLFAVILLLKYYSGFSKISKYWYILILLPLLYLNYILYLILFLQLFIFIVLFKNNNFKSFVLAFLIFLLVFIFSYPLLDTFNDMSWFKDDLSLAKIASSLKKFPNNILFSAPLFPKIYKFEQDGWVYATQEENYSESTLGGVFSWTILMTPLVWLLIIFGLLSYKTIKHRKFAWIFFWILLASFFSQMIASYFMKGNHIFTKRLVLITSFLALIPFSWGIFNFYKSKLFAKKEKIVAIFIFLALVSTTVYISGPKFRVVTHNEHKASQFIWQKLKDEDKPFCVLANTWPLLSLEAVSNRNIVTGGFPYYFEYRQPERVQLFNNMNQNPSVKYLKKALEITKARDCYFMTEQRWINFSERSDIINRLDEIMGKHKTIGQVYIWHYKPKQ